MATDTQAAEYRGTIALLLGIGSMFCGPVGVGAIVLGNQVRSQVPADDPQASYGRTGKILGWVGLLLFGLGLLLSVAVVVAILCGWGWGLSFMMHLPQHGSPGFTF